MGSSAPPKVSVVVMTYNHRRFIEQALDSALGQRTAFPCELLISEDCSTDGTREIVQDYQRRQPERIRLLLSERNLRSNAIVARGIEAARGQYIAMLDGDDYWTREDKLQRQADFLDTHPQCTACFHNASVVYEDGSAPPRNWVPPGQKPFSTLEDIWMGNFIPMCSVMYRNGVIGRLPGWYAQFDMGATLVTDWQLHLLHAEKGLIGYIDEVMGVYRQHPGGLYSRLSEVEKQAMTLKFYRKMNDVTEGRHARLANAAISNYFLEWAEEYARRGERGRGRECLQTCLQGAPFDERVSLRRLLGVAAKLWLPSATAILGGMRG
jgi:glycosyltransferase involved in cell wall biosynthesis